jgi:hypothetical protein
MASSFNHTLLGTYVGTLDASSTSTQDAITQQYDSFVSAMGQTADMIDTYVDQTQPESNWISDAGWLAAQFEQTPWAQSVIPVIGIPMASQGEDADTSFQDIISGSEDSIFNGIFQAWASDGYKQLVIRAGWEMNGNWEPWSVTSANASDYVAAFQHIAALAHSFTSASIQVVWNPNAGSSSIVTSDLYPGNASVDIVGLDSYGEPVNTDSSPNDTSADPTDFTLLDALALAKANGKPFALPETGATFPMFPAALSSVIANSGVQVAFVNIWDADDSGSLDLSWSTESDNQTAAAWKQAFQTIANSNRPTSALPLVAATQTAEDESVTAGAAASPRSLISVTDTATAAVTTIDGANEQDLTDDGAIFILTLPGVATVTLGLASVQAALVHMSSVSLTAGAAAATVTADEGANSFTSGKGRLDVTGGDGVDTYIYHSGDALLTVEDFSATKGDRLVIDAALRDLVHVVSDRHGGTMLMFGTPGGGIDLKGVEAMSPATIRWA